MEIDMRTYLTDVAGELHDVRGLIDPSGVYHPESYAAGQALGRATEKHQCMGHRL